MSKTVLYSRLPTEQPNRQSAGLDQLSAEQIVHLMNREDRNVVDAVSRATPQISEGAKMITAALRAGGKLHLVGAGTSGRLAVLEAAECPPTFNTHRVRAIMAGGRRAVFKSQEGAEDQERPARKAVRQTVGPHDVVVGIAASGVTAFARTALQEAKRRGAKTILMTCNSNTASLPRTDVRIILPVGPEVLTGSTRLKSGTACKMALNMLTTAGMVGWGKVYDHWMVDLQPKSKKLVARGLRLVQDMGRVSEAKAQVLLKQTGGRVKPAILMGRQNLTYSQAVKHLSQHDGFLRKALQLWR